MQLSKPYPGTRTKESEGVGKTIYDSIPHMHSIECANNKILVVGYKCVGGAIAGCTTGRNDWV